MADKRISEDDNQYLQNLQAEQQAITLTLQRWVSELTRRYKLQQNDQITPEGRIVRAADREGVESPPGDAIP